MGYFNWEDVPITLTVDAADWGGARGVLRDFWTGAVLRGKAPVLDLPAHHSRLIEVEGVD